MTSGPTTTLMRVPIGRLRPAPWNYKRAGTAREKSALRESIRRDRSAGVLLVRELDDDALEVVDGNHRLEALLELGWAEVDVESLGRVDQATAVFASRRRNLQWFDDDLEALGLLIQEEIAPTISRDELELILPGGADEFTHLVELAAGGGLDALAPHKNDRQPPFTLVVRVTPETRVRWRRWRMDNPQCETSGDALAAALRRANGEI